MSARRLSPFDVGRLFFCHIRPRPCNEGPFHWLFCIAKPRAPFPFPRPRVLHPYYPPCPLFFVERFVLLDDSVYAPFLPQPEYKRLLRFRGVAYFQTSSFRRRDPVISAHLRCSLSLRVMVFSLLTFFPSL